MKFPSTPHSFYKDCRQKQPHHIERFQFYMVTLILLCETQTKTTFDIRHRFYYSWYITISKMAYWQCTCLLVSIHRICPPLNHTNYPMIPYYCLIKEHQVLTSKPVMGQRYFPPWNRFRSCETDSAPMKQIPPQETDWFSRVNIEFL